MSVLRKHVSANFTKVPNSLLRDPNLDGVAKWLVAYMLSKPDGWRFSAERIALESTEGRSAILSAMTRAEEAGWVLRRKLRGPDGMFTYEHHVREELDVPWPDDPPETGPIRVDGATSDGATSDGATSDGATSVNRSPEKDVVTKTDLVRQKNKDGDAVTAKAAVSRKPRARNVHWDALVECFGDPATASERSFFGSVSRELRDAGATPEQIVERYNEAVGRGWAKFTPRALAKNWTSLGQRQASSAGSKLAGVNEALDVLSTLDVAGTALDFGAGHA